MCFDAEILLAMEKLDASSVMTDDTLVDVISARKRVTALN